MTKEYLRFILIPCAYTDFGVNAMTAFERIFGEIKKLKVQKQQIEQQNITALTKAAAEIKTMVDEMKKPDKDKTEN